MVVGLGVGFGGDGVCFTLDGFDLFVGFGADFEEVAFHVSEDLGGFTGTFGTEALGALLAFTDHALEDLAADELVVVDAF